jgi:hypothetical protein
MSIAADASIVVASMWRMLLAWSGRSEMSERSQLVLLSQKVAARLVGV